MSELFVIGTFWFWVLVGVELVILLACMEYESGVLATLAVIAFAVCLDWFGNVDILPWLWAHPIHVLIILAAYLLLGVGWGIFKWWSYLHDRLEHYLDVRFQWLVDQGAEDPNKMPEALKVKWAKWLEQNKSYFDEDHRRYINLAETPQARRNKARITTWMAYWPISAVWYLLRDFVLKVFRRLYASIATHLQRMADKIFAPIKDDLPSNHVVDPEARPFRE